MEDYDFEKKIVDATAIAIVCSLWLVLIYGFIVASIEIRNMFDPTYAKKVEQESLYIAKCKSVSGIHAITSDTKYCYKDGKVVEIE